MELRLVRCLVLGMLSLIGWPVPVQGEVLVEVEELTSSRAQPSSEMTSAEIKDQHYMLKSGDDTVSSVLRLIESQRKHCSPGQELELEGVVDQYGVKKFSSEAQIALNRANLLTRWWKHSAGVFSATDMGLRKQTEYLLYAAVRTMVELNENIFGAGNCYDHDRYPHYPLFCPFAHRTPTGEILAKDLSVAYEYNDQMEFFGKPKEKANLAIAQYQSNTTRWHHISQKGLNEFRTSNVTEDILLVDYEDGHWSKPYYDCGGGNIWMMTYTVPFFGYNHTTHQYHFMGTSGIDIDLRRVDIDQCPLKPGSTDKNVFAGSAKCKPTTQCEPISGLGFSRGSYVCRCQHGYYFPDKSAYENGQDHFNGTVIEQEFEKRSQGLNNTYDTGFICLPCAEGCTEGCKDAAPCIAALNWTLRTAILVAAIIVMACLPVLFYFTFQYAEVKVIKAASPVLLRMVLVGAFLLYGPIIVLYPVPSVVSCTARVWLRGVGFAVSYGAILLKTWRISVVFRVRSAQRVKITDNNLVKRLCLIVGFFAFYLTVRTVVAPPEVKIGVTDDNLKAFLCQMDYWDYAQAGGELLLLLWGIKLCFVVRKAPSEFNESKFISWAIYNEFLLSLFLNISMLFLQRYANPDVLYIILFAHSQLTTTVVLVLLFGSKAYMVYKGMGKGSADHAMTTNAEPTRSSAKFITKKKDRAGVPLTSSSTSAATLNCNHDSYKGQLPGHLTPKEVQDEFKRLYLQLELLKTQNMRLGNPHLTMKLHAMTEAAGMPDEIVRPHNLATNTNSLSSCPPYPAYPPPSLHTPSSPSDETAELVEPVSSESIDNNKLRPQNTLIPNNVLIATPTLIPMDPEVTPLTSPVDDVTSVFSSVSLPKYTNNVAVPDGGVIPTSNSLNELKHRPVQGNHVNHTPHQPFEFKKSRKAFEITI